MLFSVVLHVFWLLACTFYVSFVPGAALTWCRCWAKKPVFMLEKSGWAILLVPVAHKLKCRDPVNLFIFKSVMCVIVAKYVMQKLATCMCVGRCCT